MRKNLKADVRISILARASPSCEICGRPTSFVRFTEIGGKRIGRFAHIRAVSENGPRYDADYPSEKIDLPENIFWCCVDCHEIVDNVEKWTLAKLEERLKENRARDYSKVELVIEGEINVSGEDTENIIGIDAGRKTTILKSGTVVNVKGKGAKNVIGVKS